MAPVPVPRADPIAARPSAALGSRLVLRLLVASLFLTVPLVAEEEGEEAPMTTGGLAAVLENSPEEDWRSLDPARTLVVELEVGRVVIELAPAFAPAHVDNLAALVAARYFDGLEVFRAQDDYVVQWGDPEADEEGARSFGDVPPTVDAELDRPIEGAPPFRSLRDPDAYAPETGFSGGFPAARDAEAGRTWLVHCYGMVGAARDVDPDSGGPSQLYAVIGHAPRHLDRNVTLLGRVVGGVEHLSTLPRGTGDLGFYEEPERGPKLVSVRLASELEASERPRLEVLRTDSETFARWIEARRTRTEGWFVHPVGAIEVCNVQIPVREGPAR